MEKKILWVGVLALGLNGLACADDFGGSEYSGNSVDYNPGIYFGGQLGMTNMHYKGSEYTLPTSTYDDKYGIAARGYLGYAFSQFISAEFGYTYYGRPKFQHKDGNTQNILQHGLDLVAKATLPLDYGFGVYLKGGIAWVYRSALHSNGGQFAAQNSNNKFTPVGALGVNYWFAPNIALDLGWTKTMKMGNLPTIDLFTLGLIYKINL